MRDIYYQSVGNPLQLDRLPATRPAIEMLPPAASATAILSQVSAAFMAITGAALITLIVYRPPGLPWLEPYDFLLGIPILLAGIAACLVTARMEWLLHPVFLAALDLRRRQPTHSLEPSSCCHFGQRSGFWCIPLAGIGSSYARPAQLRVKQRPRHVPFGGGSLPLSPSLRPC